jgi:GAF domain-containing protein
MHTRIHTQGVIIGVMQVINKDAKDDTPFTDDDTTLLETFAVQVSVIPFAFVLSFITCLSFCCHHSLFDSFVPYLANQAALAVNNAKLFEETSRALVMSDALLTVSVDALLTHY